MPGSAKGRRSSGVFARPAAPKKVPQPAEEPDEDLRFSDDEEGSYIDGIFIPPPIRQTSIATSSNRLIIQKITNSFFKSYPNGTVLGPFSKCFNAIVGPNGSGKSNVIDSMLFVFGYRAKRLRSKNLSVLIHNSGKFSNVQSCCVAVHFCLIVDKPGDEYEVVPGSEFVVSRTAYKDNSSYYELNGKKVHFKEVAKLLRHHGIDLDHNRFLILQGEIEEIAMMKPRGATENETGLLEYLEDIIGTTRYKKPLFQLNEKIEHLSTIRTEKLNRLQLIEKELEELRGPMEEAVGFLRNENVITTCRNFLYQKNIYELEEKMQEVQQDKDKVTEQLDGLNGSLQKLAEEKEEKERAYREENGRYNKLQQRKEKLREAFNAAEKQDVQLQVEMEQTNKNRKNFKQQLENERKKLADLERVPKENAKSVAECEAKEAELSNKKEKYEEEKTKMLASIKAETQDLQAEKEELETNLNRLKQTVDTAKSAFDLAAADVKLAQSQEETERNKLETFREKLKSCKVAIKEANEQIAQLRKKIPLTEKSLNGALQDLNAVKQEEAAILTEMKQKRGLLQEKISAMQSSRSRGQVLDTLMKQKSEGKCPGLFGRLGDLGAIDAKYDVAISTACGPLDNIVVDTAETAKWCIAFIKKHSLGRATFIPLNKQEHLQELANSKIKTPENVHRLYDLIQIEDGRLKPAFYYALRDTLVANDLAQATRIAYGETRFRVVTLKGELIETSGTMSGGGRSVSRGRMGQSVLTNVDPKEIEKMELDLNGNEHRLRELQQRKAALDGQVAVLQPQLNEMRVNLERFTKDLQHLQNQQPHLEQQVQRQEKVAQSTKANEQEIRQLTAVLETKRKQFDKAQAAADEIQVKVDEVSQAIAEKTTGKMKNVNKNLNDAIKGIKKCKDEVNRLRVAITTSQRNAKNSSEKIRNLEQDIVDAESRIKAMKEQRDTIEVEAKKLLTCIEEIEDQLQNFDGDCSSLKQEINAIVEEEKKLLLKKVDVAQLCKTVKEKLRGFNAQMHEWTAKLSQLKLHDIPDETFELAKFSQEEMKEKNPEVIQLEMQTAQSAIKDLKPNLNVIKEFQHGQKIYMEKAKEVDEITGKRNEILAARDQVRDRRRDEFMVGYNTIRLKLKEMYQMITLGGDADFEIVDTCDPFADGIQLNVRPPKKSWKDISNLSGGEKTLTSLALVFAIHYFKPSPLYVMDEIDAALDFRNVSIVGNYIKERTKNAQFIIISLRSMMFELCDNLVGIYKISDCTHSLTVDPKMGETDENKENDAFDRLQNANVQPMDTE